MKLFQFVFVLAIVFVVNVQSNEETDDEEEHEGKGSLTKYFAVELDQDDEALAREVAKLHGFEYGGRIGSLPGHFQLIRESKHAESDEKRGDIPYPSLREHPNVKWHEQQRELILQKRSNFDDYNADYLKHYESEGKSDLNYYNDPKFPKQWYINSVGKEGEPIGSDMAILKAWKMGYTGKGIVVTVMDDGLDHTNRDLKKNFDFGASTDLNDHDGDPQPRDAADQYHGTKCSGEIAAEANNNFCGVGLAPDVKIGGIRMLDGKVTGITEAGAFGFNMNHVDIYSASWGPKDNGKTLAGPSTLGKKALFQGVTHGRNGKGSIYVWASGNGGGFQDDCGCDGYASSIYTIAVGSVSSHGKTTYYDEKCAATMAVVYSGDDTFGGTKPLVTTARGRDGCVDHFGGTSAAAPLAVGLFALVLQANKDLTWRDIQHIITKTANKDKLDMKDLDWKTNGAGFKINHKFGFGLLNAVSMIKAAKNWKTVPKQRTCTINGEVKLKEIKRDAEMTLTLIADACKGSENHITKLEHIQVVITLGHRRRGCLSIEIDSPSKTNSRLLSIRPNDASTKGVKQWPFMSVHFWGENPNGVWKLTIKDNSKLREKRIQAYRRFDDNDIQARSEPDDKETLFKIQEYDEPFQIPMPYRHEVELEDESEDESEDEGRKDFAREQDDTKLNIFDIRSNVYGEMKSWSLVLYGTGE
ncbi:hypothetical protein QZH41_020664 [Actinostola sp. cb2023]|nr:hypothetical protein QZH41_020664 [Actinostola sp. cb2023]